MSVAKHIILPAVTFSRVILILAFILFSVQLFAQTDYINTTGGQENNADLAVEMAEEPQKTAFDTPHELNATIPFVDEHRIRDRSTPVVTFWILFSLFVVASAKYLFPIRFKETLMAVWDSRFFNFLERETGLLNHWVSLFLYINYLFSFSLLLYQSIVYYKVSHLLHHNGTLLLLLLSLLILIIFFSFKYLLMYVTAWVFKTESPTFQYLRNIFLANKFTGIILLPFLVINHYNGSGYILAVAWLVVIFMELFRLYKVARIGLSMKGFSVYHLILYLCAVEIAPVIFLVKYSETLIY